MGWTNGQPQTAASLASRRAVDVLSELIERDEQAKKPACGSGGSKGGYNTALHVAALIIILTLSTLACGFPILVRHFPALPVPHKFLFLSRHFGTGVLIATAFVHLLPTAFVSLTNPCLPRFWNKGYPAMAGLIAMTSVLIVVGIEMFFATKGAGHVHGGDYGVVPEEGNGSLKQNGKAGGHHRRQKSLRPFKQVKLGPASPMIDDDRLEEGSSRGLMDGELSPYPDTANGDKTPDSDDDLELDELDPASAQAPSLQMDATLTPAQNKALLQVMLLEAGILFHSVFIGLALSVSTGPPFVVLLIAISFHQTFEGLALGSRIAAIPSLPPSSPKPWLMALAYGTTTPIGQAIGLAVHTLYDPRSEMGLVMVGIMNAISSGLLLFAGLVELLAEDFLSDESYVSLKGARRKQACGSVVAGAALMALVGAWA